jgi:PelA/Pel-15E family pectate lyase
MSSFHSISRSIPVLAFWLAASALAADAPYPWPKEPQFVPVTAERVAALPAKERAAWQAYLERSATFAAKLPAKRADFVTPDLTRIDGPGIPGKHSRGLQLQAAKDWYASAEAQTVADRVAAWQSKAGAWPKGNDYTKATPPEHAGAPDVWSGGTFDNDATSWETWFLARVIAATPDAGRAAKWRDAVNNAVRYALAAQYPNGGFPQIYPLAGGYHDAITYNDDAMVQALELLRDVAENKPGFAGVPADLRAQAGPAVQRGIQCILATQLKGRDGQLTVWCQQHDAITLRPCAARNFEPVASCTNESASLTKFLMSVPQPSPAIVAAVKGAAAWLDHVALRDLTWTRQGGTGALVAKAGAAPLWARMYELGTDKPIFGDRDRTVHFDVNELSTERRSGYAWYGTWPASALAEYKEWSAKSK